MFGAFGEIDSGNRTTVRIMLLVVLRFLDDGAYVYDSNVCCLSTKYARFSGHLTYSDVKLLYLSLSHSKRKAWNLMETWVLSEEGFGCKCRGLLQGIITDRLCATTRNVRHNVKVFCDSNGLSHRCWYIACSTYLLVVCLQSVPDPGVEVRSYRNVTGRHDKC
jgi:hypothetical protein